MRISHPQSGMIVYLSQSELDEFSTKLGDRFLVSASLEGGKIWVKVRRGRNYHHTVSPYTGNPQTPWALRGPNQKDHEGRFRTTLDIPEFGMTVPEGVVIDGDTMLIEVGNLSRLSAPGNMNKKLGQAHPRQSTKAKLVDLDPELVASEELPPSSLILDDGRAAIKQAITLLNNLVQEGGKFKLCITRDGISHRLKKGDFLKGKIITEEDL